MVVFPNAKINLGLYITAKRADGYHDIATIFYPIPIHDALEINISERDEFVTTGLNIELDQGQNLILKAIDLLRKDFELPSFNVHLHKAIPMGAGLGGGSSDASFALMQVNEECQLGLSKLQLQSYAAQLGSDCAFFIENSPSIGTGRGELLERIELSLNGYHLLLINPGIHVATKEAYSNVKPSSDYPNLKEQTQLSLDQWALSNSFEESVFQRYPQVKTLKDQLLRSGAAYASMSGSGSSVFGIFSEPPSQSFLDELESDTKNSIFKCAL